MKDIETTASPTSSKIPDSKLSVDVIQARNTLSTFFNASHQEDRKKMNTNPPMASTRQVLSVFEKYQKERLAFVQSVADLASRESNIETLQGAGVLSLLRPLLLDTIPAIQQAAALALGRLANYNEELAEAVVDSDILPQLVFSLSEQNVRFLLKCRL